MEIKDSLPDKRGRQTFDKPQLAIAEDGTQLRKHTIEEVDIVLTHLAMTAENYSRTSRELKDKYSLEVTPPTIRNWAQKLYPSKYLEIQHNLRTKIGEKTTEKVTALALRGAETQANVLDRLDERILLENDISVKDLATAYSAITGATEKNLKMKLLLEDKPTSITEVRTVEQAIKELEDDDIIVDIEPEDIEEVDLNPLKEVDSSEDQDDDNEYPY